MLRGGRQARIRGGLAAALVLATVGCAPTEDASPETDARASAPVAGDPAHAGHHAKQAKQAQQAKLKPLRRGERRMTLTMDAPYTPSAPTGVGTDDYRCFLLDPRLERDAFLTGTNVLPGNPDVVHHVILFRVPRVEVARAEELDGANQGEGWTCFGGPGIDDVGSVLDDAPWLGAWAPGGEESVHQRGYGVELERGSRIVMQVHYNLLAGAAEDVSSTQLRVAPAGARLTSLRTMLLPAPVELPCRPAHDDSALCDRTQAMADVRKRFGVAGAAGDMLHLLCGGGPRPGEVQSCTRGVGQPMTIRGVAGHMHLLGRSIRIDVNPGSDRARTVLDIPVWNFDDQGSRAIRPLRLEPSDTVRVTCRHAQWLRDQLPAFEGQPDRYVVWGEGTTDEMCLGILQFTRP